LHLAVEEARRDAGQAVKYTLNSDVI